jgi:long-chain acyl-CoA synthetase
MLTTLLRRAVQADPAKAAVVQGNRRVRYDELETLAGRCAGGLRRLGVGAGDCVVVVLPNCPEFVACLFACARLHAILLPLNSQYKREELLGLIADARPKVVVADPTNVSLFAGTNAIGAVFETLLASRADPGPADPFSGPALSLYTSGSTDARKRLCCTQENLFYEAHNFVATVGLTAADNILCTIPLHHSYGLGNCLLDAVYAGSTLVMPEPEASPFAARCERMLALIREEAIRFYPGVPYQFKILAALPDRPHVDLSGLKLCVSSGDTLTRATYDRFLNHFGLPIRSLYGSTEAGSISLNTDPDETVQFGSLGPPLKNVEIRIRDGAGRDLPPGESGPIWVKSPVIPPGGYANRPDLTAVVFRDGFYNTGDLGLLDGRGHLVMTGRKQTFVDLAGHKVDVGEVEEVLQSHPQVREAAALPLEMPQLGTLLKAVVVTKARCGAAEILAHCRERLASFKIPRLVEFREALPRSPLGKILKSELGGVEAYLDGTFPGEFVGVERLAEQIREQAALCLQCEAKALARSSSFQSMGFDSLRAAELHQRLVKLTGLPLSITVLWNYPSIDDLAASIWARMEVRAKERSPTIPANRVNHDVRV